ncbi:MAG: hypothetical protein ACTSUE_23670 [Promethearchaeota archaeon]
MTQSIGVSKDYISEKIAYLVTLMVFGIGAIILFWHNVFECDDAEDHFGTVDAKTGTGFCYAPGTDQQWKHDSRTYMWISVSMAYLSFQSIMVFYSYAKATVQMLGVPNSPESDIYGLNRWTKAYIWISTILSLGALILVVHGSRMRYLCSNIRRNEYPEPTVDANTKENDTDQCWIYKQTGDGLFWVLNTGLRNDARSFIIIGFFILVALLIAVCIFWNTLIRSLYWDEDVMKGTEEEQETFIKSSTKKTLPPPQYVGMEEFKRYSGVTPIALSPNPTSRFSKGKTRYPKKEELRERSQAYQLNDDFGKV